MSVCFVHQGYVQNGKKTRIDHKERRIDLPIEWFSPSVLAHLFDLAIDTIICTDLESNEKLTDVRKVVNGRSYQVTGTSSIPEIKLEEEAALLNAKGSSESEPELDLKEEVLEEINDEIDDAKSEVDDQKKAEDGTKVESVKRKKTGTIADSIMQIIPSTPTNLRMLAHLLEEHDLPRPQSDQVTAVITACCTKLLHKGYLIKHEPGIYSRNENASYGLMESFSDDSPEAKETKKESKKAKTESKKDKTKSDSPSSDGKKSSKAPKTPPGSGTIGNAILQVIPTKPTPISELLRLLKEHDLPRPNCKDQVDSLRSTCYKLCEKGLLNKHENQIYSKRVKGQPTVSHGIHEKTRSKQKQEKSKKFSRDSEEESEIGENSESESESEDEKPKKKRREDYTPGPGTISEGILKVLTSRPMHIMDLFQEMKDKNLRVPLGDYVRSTIDSECRKLYDHDLVVKHGKGFYSLKEVQSD
eukprot:TRINITY_DN8026_c0_g1_i1.p1 TRINITY_DN8026_c0_g1~~TRINITY_DN8026_c0_g1_i1.p1  ORF type:complete len:472 (+),score=130.45 TRINITY_DN8026_c0_g1_i1:3-1418(+)